MSSFRPGTSSIPDRKSVLRITLYGFIVLFLGNLGAMIDLAFRPEIPYFDEEHLIAGGITAITTILLLGALEMYLARRKQMEATLLESNERLRSSEAMVSKTLRELEAIVSTNPDIVFTVDLNVNLIMWNPAVEVATGLAPEALKNRPILEFIVEEDRPSVVRAIQKCLENGIAEAEIRVLNAHGGSTLFQFKGVLLKDEDGSVIGITGMGRDITERKRAEEALKESEEKFRLIFDNASDGILLADAESMKFEMGNRKICEMLGYGEEEITHLRVLDLHLEKDLPYVLAGFQSGATGETNMSMDIPMKKKDGSVFLADIATSLISFHGKQFQMGIFRDRTHERMLQQRLHAAQKMEALGTLAGGIAHDFNNLLMVVLGHAELALNEISPMSPARRSITEITTAARRAADLSLQMLTYAGKAVFRVERVGLRDLVEEMAHLLKTAISKKAILNLNLERDLPPIETDPSQIRQIVMNLIINASEAIGDRSGVITVSVGATRCDEEYLRRTELREALTPGLYVHLEVTDTGGGMDAETRSRIFEPFFSTKFTGRGLGLAAVLGIVRAHKGAL